MVQNWVLFLMWREKWVTWRSTQEQQHDDEEQRTSNQKTPLESTRWSKVDNFSMKITSNSWIFIATYIRIAILIIRIAVCWHRRWIFISACHDFIFCFSQFLVHRTKIISTLSTLNHLRSMRRRDFHSHLIELTFPHTIFTCDLSEMLGETEKN